MEIQKTSRSARAIIDELAKVIVGQKQALEQMVVAVLTAGHAILEGVPGTGKTLLARVLSKIVGVSFKRIQFTPDLMPSDIIGVNIYDSDNRRFSFHPGPLFSDIILADEINRAPAKTQSALLEAMQEKQVSIDGQTHPMARIFTVFATQNPVEFEGTYPLPEAQVDRFMLKINVDYPDLEQEQTILDLVEGGFDSANLETADIKPLLNADQLVQMRETVRRVQVDTAVRHYITEIVRQTRMMPQISLGASPRAAVMLLLASKAKALIEGRDFATPDDVKAIATPVLRHRMVLIPEAEVEDKTADQFIEQLLLNIEVPR